MSKKTSSKELEQDSGQADAAAKSGRSDRRKYQQARSERRRTAAKDSQWRRPEREEDTKLVNLMAQSSADNDSDPQPSKTTKQTSRSNRHRGQPRPRPANDSSDEPRENTEDAVALKKPNDKGERSVLTPELKERPRSCQERNKRVSSSRQPRRDESNVEHGRDRQPEKETARRVANVATQTTKKSASTETRPRLKKAPEAQQTRLYVRIQKVFDDPSELSSFLTNKVNVVGVEVQAAENEVTLSDGFTYYTLTCPSKSKATKVLQLLNKKSEPRTDCRFHEFKRPKVIARGIQDLRQTAITDAMFDLDKESDDLIKIHSQKLRNIQQQIDRTRIELRNLYTHDEAKSKTETLEQKQQELEKQKEEFIEARDSLKTKLRSVEDNDTFYKEIQDLKTRFKRDCHRFDNGLPVYAMRRDIVELVKQNQVSVIVGDTGSGKSTQLVQYLQEAGVGGPGVIVCTQPRRVAAVSLAKHVSREMMSEGGQEVGYRLGCGSRRTQSQAVKILYTTDHSLLNECLEDPDLTTFSCIIVDEAHERSLYTDLLLSMIKRCLPRRPDLRVIVTSATIDPRVFQEFFGGCPVLYVPGRAFPVEVKWLSPEKETEVQGAHCEAAVKKVIEIHTQELPGDILVFVTSPAETEQCCQLLRERMSMRADFRCFQLHGKQQSEEQQEVFAPVERGKRKIVFATNCAETSITIDGIKYVVDTGLAKEMKYDPSRNLNSLHLSTISKSSADQRKGRAGRTAPGTCYRLYSQQTYDAMASATLPEILRIHLGHALLKLAELGVERDTYDFVESPSQGTIQNAMETLHFLGALSEGQITEKGRWIARLPFDPRLGLLTYLGREQGILYDCVVVAAVMSSEGGVFYRGSSEEVRRVHDVTKTMFSLDKGDCITSLAVYKAWLRVPEKERSMRCLQNGLNAKALRGIKETVSEVCRVLEQDLQIRDFSEKDVTEDLRKMIVTCYSANLCHYLGRENAGYYVPRFSRRVHLHPSSCLKTLASAPEWVVFDQLIQTSRDFITGITPVEESWIAEMDAERVLDFDPEEIRKKTVEKVFTRRVGSRAFFAVVGPGYTKLRELEETFTTSAASVVFIEAVRKTGEISVYASGTTSDAERLVEEVVKILQGAVEEAKKEVKEEAVAGTMKQGIRAVLGQGGQVQELLMPDQSRKLFIKKTPRGTPEEDILKKFSKFGEIALCKQFDQGNHWGFLIFRTAEQAVYAQRATSNDFSKAGEVEHRRSLRDETSFRVHLSWCRMACRGYAWVHVSARFFKRCLRIGSFYVDAKLVDISEHRKTKNNLRLDGITTTMTEDLIRRSLLHELDEEEDAEDIVLDVHIPRERPRSFDADDIRQKILDTFRPYLSCTDNARVYVNEPQLNDVVYRATVRFADPMEGYAAYDKVNRSDVAFIDDNLDMKPQAKIERHVPQRVWDMCEADVEEAIWMSADLNVDMYIIGPEEDTANRTLVITADSIEEAVQGRTHVDVALRGEVVDCAAAPTLFTPDGQALLEMMKRETGATATVARWSRTITIRGPRRSRMEMRKRLEQLAEQTLESEEHCLRGEDKPPGLMKTLILKYGEDLGSLIRNTGLQSATVDFRRHRLKVTGTRTSLDNAAAEVREMTEAVWAECGKDRPTGSEETEECSACLCPIDEGQLYRLELCAHPYCKDCFKHQVHYAVADKAIPIMCCHEACERPVAINDLTNLARRGDLNKAALTKAAVEAYVLTNAAAYRHCPTADCPAVYRVTPGLNTTWRSYGRLPLHSSYYESRVFVCPACCTSTCTMCDESAHGSRPCSVAGSKGGEDVDEDSTVDDWAAEDSEGRKRCPGCHCMIEKFDGCNKMVCKQCKAIFCWVCRQTFTTDRACEDHLVRKHGGIFPDDYLQRLRRHRRQARRY